MVLVTGGAGSIGKTLVQRLLHEKVKAVRVLDSDEYGLFLLKKEMKDPNLRLLLGDVKDRERMEFAVRGVDVVFHLAAAKNLEVTEYNAPETVRINVLGTLNLIERCLEQDAIEKFVYVSTDKAVNPSNLYGATKLVSEQATLWAQRISNKGLYSVARFGNVIETRGNVFDIWRRENESGGRLTVTDLDAKRYFWHVEEAAHFLVKVVGMMEGGEVFVPPMRELTMGQVLEQEMPGAEHRLVGLRKGEKLKEFLVTEEEIKRAQRMEDGTWIIREE